MTKKPLIVALLLLGVFLMMSEHVSADVGQYTFNMTSGALVNPEITGQSLGTGISGTIGSITIKLYRRAVTSNNDLAFQFGQCDSADYDWSNSCTGFTDFSTFDPKNALKNTFGGVKSAFKGKLFG